MEEIRVRRGHTSPGDERSNEAGKLVIAHGSLAFFKATLFDLVDEPKKSLYGREIDRDLRRSCRCVACFFTLFFLRTSSMGGWGGMLPYLFLLFSSPCSADHERDWSPCKVVISGWQPIRQM